MARWDIGEADLLASAYRRSVALAEAKQLKSIAFPAISTGIYGYPLEPATQIAVTAPRAELARTAFVNDVVFACFSQEALNAYRAQGVDS